jgi:hypothetical protein
MSYEALRRSVSSHLVWSPLATACLSQLALGRGRGTTLDALSACDLLLAFGDVVEGI